MRRVPYCAAQYINYIIGTGETGKRICKLALTDINHTAHNIIQINDQHNF